MAMKQRRIKSVLLFILAFACWLAPQYRVAEAGEKKESEAPSHLEATSDLSYPILGKEFASYKTSLPIFQGSKSKLQKAPKPPFLVYEGCCEEQCGVQSLTLTKQVKLRADANAKSASTEAYPPNYKFKKARKFTKVLKTESLSAGEGVALYGGCEGSFTIFNKKTKRFEEIEGDFKNLKSEEWLYLEAQDGKVGWLPFDALTFSKGSPVPK